MSGAALQTLCDYDFMRCQKCGALVTKIQMETAIGAGGTGQACACGSLKYQPTNLPWWGWLLPRVLAFAWKRLRGQA